MKKLVSLSVTVAILFSFAFAVYAHGNKYYHEDNEWAEPSPANTTGSAITTTGSAITTTGSAITPDDTIDGLKEQIRENHKDKQIRKYLLKELVQLRYKGDDDSIPVIVNGELIKFDVPPVIKQGRTLIPVRAVTTALGADVKWDSNLPNIVTITKTVGGQVITVVIDLKSGVITKSVDGATPVVVEFDVKPQVVSNRTVVPVRFLAEIFGMHVDYDQNTHGVFVDED